MSPMMFLVQSALSQGADIAVQSTHKVLGSMGQSSMLHAQGALVDRTRISRALQTLQVLCPLPALALRPASAVLPAAMQPALPITARSLAAECGWDCPARFQTTAVAAESIRGLWMLMQTSSPSYLLMSSLDAARHQAVQPSTWTEPTQAAMRICEGLCNLPGITLLERPSGDCSSILIHSSGKLLTAFHYALAAEFCCCTHNFAGSMSLNPFSG